MAGSTKRLKDFRPAGAVKGTDVIYSDQGSGEVAVTTDQHADYVVNRRTVADSVAPAYLQTLSDISSGAPVSMMRFVDRAKISSVQQGTDNSNHAPNLLDAINSGAHVHYEYGVLNFEESVLPSVGGATITMGRSAILRAQTTLDTPLLKFLQCDKPKVVGGHFDMRRSPAPASGKVRDALVFDQCIDPYHEGGTFVGVYDPTQPYATQPSHGDSGIFLSACTRGKIIAPTLINMPDCGIYVNATPTASLGATIIAPHFYQCATGIANKRGAVGTMIIGAQFDGCYYGITTEAASNGPVPGKQVYIDSMRAVNCYYPLILRWADYTVVKSPYIQNALGTEIQAAGAIWFQGTQYATVSDPQIFSDAQYPYMLAAIFLDDRIEYPPADPVNAPSVPGPAVDRSSLYNQIRGGTLTNFTAGVRENDGTKANHNWVLDTQVVGAINEGNTIDLRGANSYYRKMDIVNQVEKQSGNVWWTNPSGAQYWRSADGGTWQKGVLAGDTLDFWYQIQYRVAQINASGLSLDKDLIMAGLYSNGRIRLNGYYLWVDANGRLRIKSGAPSSDLDGTVVGTQS